ncbi:MAG: tetratricopeptide repeat protein [bacterium]|nr:tetratricopeptide repeat protein [bacterium]
MNPPIPPSLEQDLSAARDALAKGDLRHAADHLGWALQAEPQRDETLDLIDQVIAAAHAAGIDPLTLAPLDQKLSSAQAAVHAYMQAARGDYGMAVTVISKGIDALPDTHFLPLAASWLRKGGASIPEANVGELLAFAAKKHPGDHIDDDQARGRVAQLVGAFESYEAAMTAHGTPINPVIGLPAALLLRKIGEYAASLAKAQAIHAHRPTAFTLVAIAYAQRQLGQNDAAIDSFEAALALDPSVIEIHNDLGDLLMALGRFQEAAAQYGKVLDKQPDQHWAAPSYYALQYQLDSDDYWLTKLRNFRARFPDNARAAELATALLPSNELYLDVLPEPGDSIINVIKLFSEQGAKAPDGVFRMTVSALEAPSAVLAVRRWLEGYQPGAQLEVVVLNIQKPDPRITRSGVKTALWKYTGTEAAPNLPPPAAPTAEAVARIAALPFKMADWKAAARETGQRLGESAIPDLLAAMVHPPANPTEQPEWSWVFQVQVAAALVIAATGTEWTRPTGNKGLFSRKHEPTPRHQALFDLIHGAGDWTVTAGIVAATELAIGTPALDKQVGDWLFQVFASAPKGAYVPYLDALARCGMRLASSNLMIIQRYKRALQS